MSICRNFLLRANFPKRLPITNVLHPSAHTRLHTTAYTQFASKPTRTRSSRKLTLRPPDTKIGERYSEVFGVSRRRKWEPTPEDEDFFDTHERKAEETQHGVDPATKRRAPIWSYFRLRTFAKHMNTTQSAYFIHKVISLGNP